MLQAFVCGIVIAIFNLKTCFAGAGVWSWWYMVYVKAWSLQRLCTKITSGLVSARQFGSLFQTDIHLTPCLLFQLSQGINLGDLLTSFSPPKRNWMHMDHVWESNHSWNMNPIRNWHIIDINHSFWESSGFLTLLIEATLACAATSSSAWALYREEKLIYQLSTKKAICCSSQWHQKAFVYPCFPFWRFRSRMNECVGPTDEYNILYMINNM